MSGTKHLQKWEPCTWLACFRVLWGLIMLKECATMMQHDYAWLVDRYYRCKQYFVFDLLEPHLPDVPSFENMQLMLFVMTLCAICVIVGFRSRLSLLAYTTMFAYTYFTAEDRFLNHHWLFILVNVSLFPLPLDAQFSASTATTTRPLRIPVWVRYAIAAQMSIVYAYAAVNKLNADWLRGEPLRGWVGDERWWMPYALSYGGLLYDAATPFLMFATNKPAWLLLHVVASVAFAGLNSALWNIGAFPWMALLLTMLPAVDQLAQSPCWSSFAIVTLGRKSGRWWRAYAVFMTIFLLLQVAVPARQFVYQGVLGTHSADWSEEGHYFAWRMKLRDRDTIGQLGTSLGDDATIYHIPPVNFGTADAPLPHLTPDRWQRVLKHPTLLVKAARFLADVLHKTYNQTTQIYGTVYISVNHRPVVPYIQNVCLSCDDLSPWPSDWIEPPPSFQGQLRFQYPWWWTSVDADNPCLPWNFVWRPRRQRHIGEPHYDPTPCDEWWTSHAQRWLRDTQHSWWHRGWEWALGVFDDRV